MTCTSYSPRFWRAVTSSEETCISITMAEEWPPTFSYYSQSFGCAFYFYNEVNSGECRYPIEVLSSLQPHRLNPNIYLIVIFCISQQLTIYVQHDKLSITNAFAVTINKAQGKTFKSTEIYLSFVACASHDHFCAASPRAPSFENVVISNIEGPRQPAENWR